MKATTALFHLSRATALLRVITECRLREFMEATFGRDLVRSAGNAALVNVGQGNTLNSGLLYH